MNPILSHYVKALTDNLNISLKFSKNYFMNKMPTNMKINLYADIEKNAIYSTLETEKTEDEEFHIFSGSFNDPYLFYTYSIEWDFNSNQK